MDSHGLRLGSKGQNCGSHMTKTWPLESPKTARHTHLHVGQQLAHAGERIGGEHVDKLDFGERDKGDEAAREEAAQPAERGVVGHEAQQQEEDPEEDLEGRGGKPGA